jgi:hypothetical protein
VTGVSRMQPIIGHTPTPWTFRDVSGAGIEICAPVYEMKGVDLPRGMPEAPIHVFQFTSPQNVQVAAERWVQFEPTGWHEMQMANAAFIVEAVNSHATLKEQVAWWEEQARQQAARIEELEGALEFYRDEWCMNGDGDTETPGLSRTWMEPTEALHNDEGRKAAAILQPKAGS